MKIGQFAVGELIGASLWSNFHYLVEVWGLNPSAEILLKSSTSLVYFAFRKAECETDKTSVFLALFVLTADQGFRSPYPDDITPFFTYRELVKKMALRVCVSWLFK